MNNQHRLLTRTALLLALTLLFQSLRFLVPIPPFFSTFLVGSLVNACLLITTETAGFGPALFISMIAPLVAYMQQMLPLPVFIIPVALGNVIYISVFFVLYRKSRAVGIGIAAIVKTLFLFSVFSWLLTLVNINAKVASGIMFAMSWPQLVTTVIGGIVASVVVKRVKSYL